MRIGFLHTVSSMVTRFKGLVSDYHLEGSAFHILDESVVQDLFRSGPSPAITRRIVLQAMLAESAGVGLIVFTCSSTSPAVDVARQVVSVPILKVDDPMMALAVRSGTRIGMICTATTTLAPSKALLQEHAALQSKEIVINQLLVEEAYAPMLAGDMAQHDAIVSKAAESLIGAVDVIILAQASLSQLQEPLSEKMGCPVLASPSLLMEEVARRISNG